MSRGRYRRISTRMWGDEKFRALSPPQPNGQTLWVYLLTGPHTNSIPGLFAAGEAGLAEALGWPLKAFREAFREVSAKGMASADWTARVVWVPNAIIHNPPESPNVVRSWATHFSEIPECALRFGAFQALKAFVEALGQGFGKAFAEGFAEPLAKGMANQEQEQEQEHLHVREALTSSNGHHPPESAWLSAEALVELYNATIPPGHPRVLELSSGRREKAMRYLKQFPKREWWEQVFTEIGRSEFLRHGSQDRPNFRGDLDWLLTRGKDGTENALKVAEGRYRDRRAGAVEDADDDAP